MKTYKIEAMSDGSLTAMERAIALKTEWSRLERPVRVYGDRSGKTVGFKIYEDVTGVYLVIDTTKARKFWNVYSSLNDSDLESLRLLLAQDQTAGQWIGYKSPIINGASGKINGNQVIPNQWTSV